MNSPTTRSHWLDRPGNIKLLWRAFIVVLVLTVLAEFFVHLHPTFAVEGWFGFHAAFGVLACALMIAVAKLLGLLIRRPDSYYSAGDTGDD
jgi:hypothetical protein